MNLREASLQLSEEDYRALPELSYSALSEYDREGYPVLLEDDEESTTSLTFGSMVDVLTTQGEQAFKARYVVPNFVIPTGVMLEMADYLLNNASVPQLALVPDNEILAAATAFDYYRNWKDATRIEKIREGASAYFNFMAANVGLEVVSAELMRDATLCAAAFQTSPLTAKYFISTENAFAACETYYQLQFKSKYAGIPYKGMLDLVHIDHTNKVIYPCDIKTTKSIYTFEESFYKYRYYIQAAMYTQLLQDTIAEKCPELKDYKIAHYRFLVIDREHKMPIVFSWWPDSQVVTSLGIERRDWKTLLVAMTEDLSCIDSKLPKDWKDQLDTLGAVDLNRVNDEYKSKIN